MKHAPVPPFHLAFAVHDLALARRFYGGLLGCPEGRSSVDWVDFDFFGHQIVAHLAVPENEVVPANVVDGKQVPVRHFGVVLSMEQWTALSQKLISDGTAFLLAPHVRFKGTTGEQATMFLSDLSGNAIEFKAFAETDRLFAR